MELKKYTIDFMRSKRLSNRHIYIYLSIVLSYASVVTFCIFQTNLKTNREQVVIRQWREIPQNDSFDNPSVEFSHNDIDLHRDTGRVHHGNLNETNSIRQISAGSKDKIKENADRRQFGHKKVNDAGENNLWLKNFLNMLQDKKKKRSDNKLGLENYMNEMDVIPGGIENQDKIQEHSEEEPQDNFGNEGAIKEASHDSNTGYRQENEVEKKKQHLIDSLSRLLAKIDDKGIDTDLAQQLFADTNVRNSKHLPGFDPKLYPQKLDIPKLLNDFAQTGVLPEHAINKWAFHPIINPSHVCGEPGVQSKVFLLFIVKTKPDNFVKRRYIRKTWADPVRFPNIRTVFSVGVPRSSNIMKKLKTESIRYKDVLLMDYMDSYYNLTLKTTSNINWAVAHCSMADFVVSIDDDIYMATDLLIQHLQDIPKTEAERLYLGYVYKDTMPVRKETSNAYTEKWIISEKEYSFSTYPNYALGGCIIMSMKTLVQMRTMIPYTKTFAMEDVYVGILASRLGIIPKHTDLIDISKTHLNSVEFQTLIASHFYKTSEMLWKAWECHLSLNNDVEKAVFC